MRLNPFVFDRLQLSTSQGAETALSGLDQLLRDGVETDGRRFRLFGMRRGRLLTMSFGMPLLGGAAPVLRAWLRDDPGPATFDVSVTARIEVIVFGTFWILLILVGASIQLALQLAAWAAGRASARDVLDVLPGIAIMAALIGLPLWYLRRRGRLESQLLVQAFRDAIASSAESALPIH